MKEVPMPDQHKAKGVGPCDSCGGRMEFRWEEDAVGPFFKCKCPHCGFDNDVRTNWSDWDLTQLGKH